ncbi:unnamed protein product [Ixodes persulcatus]
MSIWAWYRGLEEAPPTPCLCECDRLTRNRPIMYPNDVGRSFKERKSLESFRRTENNKHAVNRKEQNPYTVQHYAMSCPVSAFRLDVLPITMTFTSYTSCH